MADISFVKVLGEGPGFTKVQASDGQTYTFKGLPAWRNNNPGNIVYGNYAKAHGAIGQSHGYAVFPDVQTGAAAQHHLQFVSPSYKNKTIAEAISSYAPQDNGERLNKGNNPTAYAAALAQALGVPTSTRLSDLTPEQQQQYLAAQRKVEVSKPGKIIGADGSPVPASVVQQFKGIPLPPAPINPLDAGRGIAGRASAMVPLPFTGPLIPSQPRPASMDAGGFDMAPPKLPLNAPLPPNRGASYGPETPQWGPRIGQLGMPTLPAGGIGGPTADQTRAEQRRPVSPIGFGSSMASGAGLTAPAAPMPMPARPAALSVAPQAPAPQLPVQPPVRQPPAPVAPPSVPQLRLASGKMIAPGIYNQGDHSVQVSDAGDGTAKITTIHGPMSVPGVIDPLREANADTIAGGMIRKMIPKVATDAMSSFNAPSAVDNVKSAALGAASNLGSTLGGFGSGITGAFSGLGGLFGGAPRPPVVPSFAQLQAMRAVPQNAYARPAPRPMQRPMNFYAAPAPQQQRPVVPMVPAPMAQGNGGGGFSNPSATYWSPSEGAWINN